MSEPYTLTLSEMIAAIRRKKLSPVELAQSLLKRIDSLESTVKAWVTIPRTSLLKEARRCEQEAARGQIPRAPARHPDRRQRYFLHGGDADDRRIENIRKIRSGVRFHGRGPAQESRRPDPGKNRDHGICHGRPGPHLQSLESGSHPGRFEQRFRRGRGHFHVPRRPGVPDRGFGPASGGLLRGRRA